MPLQPVKLAMSGGSRLLIDWSDGRQRSYSIRELREQCPCATCREKRSQPPAPRTLLPVLSAAEARPLTLVDMKPVGHYAYSIHFSDGHNTGIFTFESLLLMGEEVKPAENP